MAPEAPDYYFTRTGEHTFSPTINCEGAWTTEDYHFASLAGLIAHETERHHAREGMQLSRISYDILGRLPLDDVTVTTKVLRPGKKIELVETTATIQDRTAIIARTWYLAEHDSSSGMADESPRYPAPEETDVVQFSHYWGGGFIRQLQCHTIGDEPPLEFAWLTSPNVIVAEDERNEVAEFISRVDVANGVSYRVSPEKWAFPNVDLTIHLYRRPQGAWTGLEARNHWGPAGAGVTSTVLHDVHGPLGRAEQMQSIQNLQG